MPVKFYGIHPICLGLQRAQISTKYSPASGGLSGPQPPGHFEGPRQMPKARDVPSAFVLALWAKLSHSFLGVLFFGSFNMVALLLLSFKCQRPGQWMYSRPVELTCILLQCLIASIPTS